MTGQSDTESIDHLYLSYCKYCDESDYPLKKLPERRTDKAKIINPHIVYRSCLEITRKPIFIKWIDENDQPRYEKRVMHLCKRCGLPICYEVLGIKDKNHWKPVSETPLKKRPRIIYILPDSVSNRAGGIIEHPSTITKSDNGIALDDSLLNPRSS